MRLKTKLVLAATGSAFVIVIVLSALFLGELLRQRIAQTASANDVMARQVLLMTRQAVEVGLVVHPPENLSNEALQNAVAEALQSHDPLNDTMSSFVRYSPAVQEVSVTDANGLTLVSTDPTMVNQHIASRIAFERVRDGNLPYQWREVFGKPRVLDVSLPLQRNNKPFLIVHIGIRSSFLKDNYAPWLWDALIFALVAGGGSMVAAALLASVAVRPIEEISRRLERLTLSNDSIAAGMELGGGRPVVGALPGSVPDAKTDAVVRVTNTIDRLGQQLRTTEAGYTDLRANFNHVLDTLREGVILFTAEGRAAMVSDAVAQFLRTPDPAGQIVIPHGAMMGKRLEEIFLPTTALGQAVRSAFEQDGKVTGQRVRLEDGREVEISLDRIDAGRGKEHMGTLLTLRDAGSAKQLEQELDVSRRLAAIGRLTAGVGHEVKNPVNAMVVHLELLRAKLEAAGQGRGFLQGAQRHVDILASEMERLDRVVQTLADFTRPMELHLSEIDLREVVERVVDLTGAEMAEHNVEVRCALEPAVMVRADGEMLRQAMLNLMLNAMQAMEQGGILRVGVRRDGDTALLVVADEGPGIPPELMPRIFELYFTTKPKGSGIGLAMTYRIIQMHGGAMEVTSEVGAGAAFTMRLPLILSDNRTGSRLMAGRAS
ncbi:sensor histidine kinase [Granulicella tundricola]|uniref:histidine kinase n=1 Tax=Granulicella tundricola (strain ATCC BAA-1859 / DSM 23138 / MP5ACTX9) TaxID=1198114 RepID=E8WXI7_GRATM|nr:ATP-binding protein [Granulicella tundricola]ADW68603.1 histidine kinase [Granulicella tundricola MP5ACTX9]